MNQETPEVKQMKRTMCIGVALAMAVTFVLTTELLPQNAALLSDSPMWSGGSRILAEVVFWVLSIAALVLGIAAIKLTRIVASFESPNSLSARPLLFMLPLAGLMMATAALRCEELRFCIELLPYQASVVAGNIFLLAAFQDIAWVQSFEEQEKDENNNEP